MAQIKINLSKALRPWQKEYIANKKRFNVLVVHRRAGKTVWAVLDEIVQAMQIVWDYWYIAPTYRQAKKIAWRLIQKFGNQITWFTYNASELQVTYSNGSTISLFGAENPDSLRGLDLKGVIFDEYAQQPSWIYGEIIFPMINANRGWVTWIGTPKGKNAFYKLYERAKTDDRFFTMLLKYTDTNLLDDEQIADARKEMTEEEFAQEYECSFDAYLKWAVYGKELKKAFDEWRVRKDLYEKDLEVYTFWDLGVSDAMTILFVQAIWWEIRIIDSYKNTWYWLDHYANVVNSKPYKYKMHYFPHDIRVREMSTGTSRIETAVKLLGKNCDIVPSNTIESGINAGRLIFKHLYINEELEDFINDLSLYQYEYDENRAEYKSIPKHDWTSHYADAYRYLATIFEYLVKSEIVKDDEELNEIDVEILWLDEDDEEEEIELNPW